MLKDALHNNTATSQQLDNLASAQDKCYCQISKALDMHRLKVNWSAIVFYKLNTQAQQKDSEHKKTQIFPTGSSDGQWNDSSGSSCTVLCPTLVQCCIDVCHLTNSEHIALNFDSPITSNWLGIFQPSDDWLWYSKEFTFHQNLLCSCLIRISFTSHQFGRSYKEQKQQKM